MKRVKTSFIVVLVALAFAGCHLDCGPNSPTGPCETACKPKPCAPLTYCCPPPGGCCDNTDTCVLDDNGPWCEGPSTVGLERKARKRRHGL